MRHAVRLGDQRARSGDELPVTKLQAHLALQDVRKLVLVMVGVHWRSQRSPCQRVLDKRETSPRLFSIQQEACSEAADMDEGSFVGQQNTWLV